MGYIGIDAKKDIRLNATSDLDLTSDSTTIKFGADDDVTLTHVHNTGLTLNSTNKIMFNDASQFIQGSSATVLSLGATDEIDLTATAIDINGTADVSGTLGVGGILTANAGVVVDNITIDGTEIDLSSGDLTIDVAGDISLDADGGDIRFKDNGDEFGTIYNTSSNLGIASINDNKDIIFQGFDDTNLITALTLDMSEAGAATFNSTVIAPTMTLSRSSSNSPNVEPVLLFDNIDSVIAANENIGSIRFTTSAEGSGGDAQLESGRIACFSESGHGSTTNASALAFYTASSEAASSNERMRIDSSGHVFVAKTSSALATVGSELLNDGRIVGTADGQTVLLLNRKSSDGNIIEFYKDNSIKGYISYRGAELQIGQGNAALQFSNGSDCIVPANENGTANDDAIDLGLSNARFDDIFATNGTIQTSDENEKQDIASMTTSELAVGKRLSTLFKTFRWKSKVTEKADKARTHSGIVAQEVKAAFEAEGLDATKYALFCSDTWTNDDGDEQTRMGVRYPELLSFIASYNESRFTAIEARLTALEGL